MCSLCASPARLSTYRRGRGRPSAKTPVPLREKGSYLLTSRVACAPHPGGSARTPRASSVSVKSRPLAAPRKRDSSLVTELTKCKPLCWHRAGAHVENEQSISKKL